MASSRKVRIKKLNPKAALPIFFEDDIDPSEYECLTTDGNATSGVEKAEESEYHLQAVLKGSAIVHNEIPVPPPQVSEVSYDELYPRSYIEPHNYVKSSETVEETISCLYDMTAEDDDYLKKYNANKKPAGAQLSEDDFERIMEFFENTAAEQAPFASVDNTVVSYEVMAQSMVLSPINKLQNHTKQVYEYWKLRRHESGNRPLHPTLKFETHQERDDMDPYVCFRRREVRQTRKTRARDAQIADKLKKLRRELEDGRQLILLSHQREMMKRQMLQTERDLFERRAKLKEKKIRLGIKVDDEDLYTTKPQKRKISEVQQQARALHPQLRVSIRNTEGRPVEQELVLLSDKIDERDEELRRDIAAKVQNHKIWNQHHIDLTEKPLSPVHEEETQSFRQAKAQFLPTPPASTSDSMELDEEPAASVAPQKAPPPPYIFKGVPPEERSSTPASYRRRIGRGGRLWIDRRGVGRLASPPSDHDAPANDRFKYDQDDSDDEQPVYHVDPYGTGPMRFRASIPPIYFRHPRHVVDAAGSAQLAAAQASRQALPQPPAQAQQPTPQRQQSAAAA